MRVQIPVYTDRWMMGDRYGEIIRVTAAHRTSPKGTVKTKQKIAHVKLDISGRTIKVLLDDCTEV